MAPSPAEQQIGDRLDALGDALRTQPSVRDAVMGRVRTAPTPRRSPALGRVGRLLALAACALVALALWNTLGNGSRMLGADAAFAAAIENVAKARTFVAHKTSVSFDDAGVKSETHETSVMFKEPGLERIEWLKGLPSQVTVTDYTARRQLTLLPDEKKAVEQSIKTLYTVDMSTGQVKPAQLHTAERDEVLKLAAQGVKDLGVQKLDGKEVRVLESADAKEPVKKIFVDPKTNAPVRIELTWPSRKGASFTYSSIRIDEPLDDKLFDLTPPAGYAVVESDRGEGETLRKPIEEHAGKMLAKMVYTVRACYQWSFKHDNQFPETLDDLKGTVDENALRTLLAAADKPDGPPVIVYRKPRAGKDPGTEIVVYEAPESRQAGHVVVGMWDGHAEVLTQERFDELMKD